MFHATTIYLLSLIEITYIINMLFQIFFHYYSEKHIDMGVTPDAQGMVMMQKRHTITS